MDCVISRNRYSDRIVYGIRKINTNYIFFYARTCFANNRLMLKQPMSCTLHFRKFFTRLHKEDGHVRE